MGVLPKIGKLPISGGELTGMRISQIKLCLQNIKQEISLKTILSNV